MTTINQAIAASTADGQAGSGAGYNAATASITIGGYFGTANFWGLWPSTGIPQGASISAATVTATKTTTATGTAEIIWYGNDVDAPAYPTSDSDYNAKVLTTASAAHSASGSTGTYTSPSLVSIIQELVDRPGFNGDILLLAKDNNSNATHGGFENRITLKAYDGGSGTYATLNVTYTDPVTGVPKTNRIALLGAG